MEVTLPPDLHAYAEELVASGEFDDASVVVTMALRHWRSERDKVLALIQEGIDDLDNGRVRDGAEVMRELTERFGSPEAVRAA